MSNEMENLVVELTESVRSRHYGKYRGIVRDVNDPDGLGRIKAQVPEVYEAEDSPWALPVVPFAGPSHGLVLLPEVGDGVWIEFEAGDISRPLWTGCWWGSREMPSPADREVRVLATTAGHKLIMDDDGRTFKLQHAGGAEITMTDNDITLKIGSSQIVLSATGISVNNGAMEVR